jgi:adenine-specific DNA-methyltransferase
MKYMGSKRAMLLNGLGKLIDSEVTKANRFVDLFSGSAAVACYVATRYDVKVRAFDLQEYGVALANAVVMRTAVLDADEIWQRWEKVAGRIVRSKTFPSNKSLTQKIVKEARVWSAESGDPITRAYGGHYFSCGQAVWIDALRQTLPAEPSHYAVALAALIQASSECAAAPGHTAQPFQPTKTAKRYLADAWDRDVRARTKRALGNLCSVHAKKLGHAKCKDANNAAKQLRTGDLVFVDPPYSGVHYSRFYHVLETVARGYCGEVSGVGRYPSREERPRSKYSVGTESNSALDDLLATLAARETTVILTFPDHECSNGLSGEDVVEIARKHFRVKQKSVKSEFSTMGGIGNGNSGSAGRDARQHADELILLLKSKG